MKQSVIITIIALLLVLSTLQAKAQIVDTVCASAKGEVYRVHPTPGSIYLWSVEGGTIISSNKADSVVVNWTGKPGLHTISVIEVTKYGCLGDTISAMILVNDHLDVIIEGPSDICEGDIATLRASGASRYLWSTGATSPVILVQPRDTTDYRVVGFSGRCAPDTEIFRVRVHPKPHANFTFNPHEPVVDEEVNFQYTGKTPYQVQWYFGDRKNTIINDLSPTFIFDKPGEKDVTLVAKNKSGCMDSITYKLYIKFESHIFVPTSFTPDGDQTNDVFKAVTYGIHAYKLTIFNRWGERIFETDDMTKGWDGKFKGEDVEEGVYLYQITAQAMDGQWYYPKGTVTLLR